MSRSGREADHEVPSRGEPWPDLTADHERLPDSSGGAFLFLVCGFFDRMWLRLADQSTVPPWASAIGSIGAGLNRDTLPEMARSKPPAQPERVISLSGCPIHSRPS